MPDKPTTKDLILDAAENVVARDGAGRLTIDAVAAESGVSKGGVLYHYPNKIALLQAMVERMVTSIRDDLAAAEAAAKAAGEPVMPHIVAAMFERVETKNQVSNALLAASSEHPELLDTACAILNTEFERLAEEAPDPVLANVILLAVDGMKLGELLGLSRMDGSLRAQILQRLTELSREMYA